MKHHDGRPVEICVGDIRRISLSGHLPGCADAPASIVRWFCRLRASWTRSAARIHESILRRTVRREQGNTYAVMVAPPRECPFPVIAQLQNDASRGREDGAETVSTSSWRCSNRALRIGGGKRYRAVQSVAQATRAYPLYKLAERAASGPGSALVGGFTKILPRFT